METTKSFTLIQGTFKILDARYLLLNLYNEKILYHNRQLAHIRECNAGDAAEVAQKIADLESIRKSILEFFSVQDANLQVQVNSDIQISFDLPMRD